VHQSPGAVVLSECFGSFSCYENVWNGRSEKMRSFLIFRRSGAFSNQNSSIGKKPQDAMKMHLVKYKRVEKA